MTQCRMCSQRLTRPGRLCRECERELDRARAAAQSVGNLSSAVPLIDAARTATADSQGWSGRLQSRPTILMLAFSVGIATAGAFYVVQRSHAAGKPESVMIDRDLSNIRPRDHRIVAPARTDTASRAATPVTLRTAAYPSERREPVVATPATTGSRRDVAASNAAAPPAATASPRDAASPESPAASAAYDRVLGLASALDACSHESLFARIACEHRARTRYCDGAAGQIPQCAERPPREYGQ